MCVLCISSKRKVTEEEFTNCFESNSDGAGFAWYENGKLNYKKGFMTKESAWNFYKESINTFPHILHFRIGTSGGKIPELTHPFIVNKESPLQLEYSNTTPLLFHNGVVSNWEELLKDLKTKNVNLVDPISDTRVIAAKVSIEGNDILKTVSGKYVLMEMDKVYMYGDFTEENGVRFSNSSYKYKKYVYSDWYKDRLECKKSYSGYCYKFHKDEKADCSNCFYTNEKYPISKIEKKPCNFSSPTKNCMFTSKKCKSCYYGYKICSKTNKSCYDDIDCKNCKQNVNENAYYKKDCYFYPSRKISCTDMNCQDCESYFDGKGEYFNNDFNANPQEEFLKEDLKVNPQEEPLNKDTYFEEISKYNNCINRYNCTNRFDCLSCNDFIGGNK